MYSILIHERLCKIAEKKHMTLQNQIKRITKLTLIEHSLIIWNLFRLLKTYQTVSENLPQSPTTKQPWPESKLPPGPTNSQYGQAYPGLQWQFPLLLHTYCG